MAAVKFKKLSRARINSRKNRQPSRDPDDLYFRKHFSQLVRDHGGKWIVLVEGNLIGIRKKDKIRSLVSKAKARYPDSTLFIAPIPTKDELECVL